MAFRPQGQPQRIEDLITTYGSMIFPPPSSMDLAFPEPICTVSEIIIDLKPKLDRRHFISNHLFDLETEGGGYVGIAVDSKNPLPPVEVAISCEGYVQLYVQEVRVSLMMQRKRDTVPTQLHNPPLKLNKESIITKHSSDSLRAIAGTLKEVYQNSTQIHFQLPKPSPKPEGKKAPDCRTTKYCYRIWVKYNIPLSENQYEELDTPWFTLASKRWSKGVPLTEKRVAELMPALSVPFASEGPPRKRRRQDDASASSDSEGTSVDGLIGTIAENTERIDDDAYGSVQWSNDGSESDLREGLPPYLQEKFDKFMTTRCPLFSLWREWKDGKIALTESDEEAFSILKQMCEVLIDAGAQVSDQEEDSSNLLHLLCSTYPPEGKEALNTRFIQMLTTENLHPDHQSAICDALKTTNKVGQTPIQNAVFRGRNELAKFLLFHGLSDDSDRRWVLMKRTDTNSNVLHSCCRTGNYEFLRFIILCSFLSPSDKSKLLHQRNTIKSGKTPLDMAEFKRKEAAEGGQDDLVKRLDTLIRELREAGEKFEEEGGGGGGVRGSLRCVF